MRFTRLDALETTDHGWHWALPTWGKTAALGLFSLAAVIGYANRIEPKWIQWKRLRLPIDGLPEAFAGYRIVLLSDLHLSNKADVYPVAALRALVARVNRLHPDCILFAGDFVTEIAPSVLKRLPLLNELHAPDGVYGTLGNHDYWSDSRLVKQALTGLHWLLNDAVIIRRGAAALGIAGVDNIWEKRADLPRAMAELPPDLPTILMAHEPNFGVVSVGEPRVRLQVSGHTHGGQVRVPFIGPVVLPELSSLYPMGLYKVKRDAAPLWIYTSRGLGMSDLPLRFACRPEVTVIELIPT